MPYLTPESIPEGDDCRPLFIPADGTWLALFGGALTELTKQYNWQQFGALTVAETVAKMQSIVDSWYEGTCSACTTPGGYRVIRVSVTGHIEQLNDAGEWETATDEYYIPPPAAREGGSPDDQICLAAKNAVNVLQELYESISDSWNGDLDEAEAVTAMIAVFAGTVGFAIAPITWGIFAFFAPIFAAMYALVEYVIADLWDEAVSEQITCFLVECATNTEGVVTFDYECFYAKLNSLANGFSLTVEQIRLYLQIQYLLYFIGGIDGLNLAATTTIITDDDCAFCGDCADILCEFIGDLCDGVYIATSDPAGFYLFPVYPGSTGTYQSSGGAFTGQGWIQSVDFPSTSQERSCCLIVLPDECPTMNSFQVFRYLNNNGSNYNYIAMFDASEAFIADQTVTGAPGTGWYALDWTSGVQVGVKYIMVMLDSQDGSVNGIGQITVGIDGA